MKLVGLPYSYRATAALMALEACGIEHSPDFVEWAEHKTDKILKLNPQGKTPILVTPDGPLYETMAIIRHASRISGKLRGTTPFEHAQVDQWLSWTNGELGATLPIFYYQHMGFELPGMSFKHEDIQRGKEAFLQCLSHLATSLQGRQYLVGNDLTVADIAVACYVY